MKAIAHTLLVVGAVFFLADAICYGNFESFAKGFIACGLTLKFFDGL